MKAAQIYLLLHVFLTTSVLVNTFNFYGTFFKPQESCDSDWISFNATGLQADLKNKLFGQHIVSPIILKAVNGFMNNDNPKKPLVLSLQGPTGTGKSFVSSVIAENIYKKGMDSSFVHVFISTYHFPHSSEIDIYKSQLKQWIKGNVTNCERSMFIFDEMEKMHPGLIDIIKPYLDYFTKLDGVSYQKSIFIFLSNAGGENITEKALEFKRAGKDREEIALKDLETLLSASAFNNSKSGLWHSSLIEQNMVDFFIPFLPLEYQHVVQCVMTEMKAEGLKPDQDVADEMARDLDYLPKFERVFSVRGCKTIASRLHFYTKFIEFRIPQGSCDSDQMSFSATGLQTDLKNKLFGQHIASDIILKAVNEFMNNDNSDKPLVLSLHGPTGTGKSLVSELIAKNIYKEGMDSRFVHVFISAHHFPHFSQIETYKAQLKQWIEGNVTNCARSMFIFDKMDIIQPSLIDIIKPYLNHYNRLNGVSYGKAIFIFLSNAGGESITEKAFEFKRAGQDREKIELKDLDTLLPESSFNKESGLWQENMVDFFIPFLPLEYQHVVQCIMTEMKAKGLKPDQDVADEIARYLDYFHKFEGVFSVRGCYAVLRRLDFYT